MMVMQDAVGLTLALLVRRCTIHPPHPVLASLFPHTWHIKELISIPLPSDLHSPLPIRGGLAGVNIQILKMEMERLDIASAFAF